MNQENFNPGLKDSIKKKGLVKFFLSGLKLYLEFIYYKFFKKGYFILNKRKHNYFYSLYNATWRNEREIEIPIIKSILKRYKPEDVLEIGNVLSHYFDVGHDIIDKYEKVKGVLNKDILDFKSKKKYDIIVAISTFEHVGWDETPKDAKKILRAIEVLKKSLTNKGKIIFTHPMNYNPQMDELIWSKKLKLSKKYYLKRISKDNQWVEIDESDSKNLRFNSPFSMANGILLGIIEK